LANPNYSTLANSRADLAYYPRVYPRSFNMHLRAVIPADFRDNFRTFLARAGFRVEFTIINPTNPISTSTYSISEGRVSFLNAPDGGLSLDVIVPGRQRSQLRDRWINRVRIFYQGSTYDVRLQYPMRIFDVPNNQYNAETTQSRYGDIGIGVEVIPISASRFELVYSFDRDVSGIPIFVDIPSEVSGAGDAAATYRINPELDRLTLDGYVDNRVLGVWNFSYITPESLPVRGVHAHFEPFVSPSEVIELENIGIQVYIDEFGLVHFPSTEIYQSYLRSHVAGIKFNREWLHSRDLAKSAYADVAASLPDKFLATKSAMLTNFDRAVRSDRYDRAVNRFKDNQLLSELFASRLDGITEIAQAKVNKLVRSVEKKRTLADRLSAIIDYYRTNPNSSVSLPAGIPDAQIKSLVSQPLSKLLRDIEPNSTDAEIAESLANDLITRLGFSRRVIA